ncbi:hypothetical protein [Candidatus Pelagibacter sp.]|uniref:hypothetical protein n=1 Tax=Candidatus Pelagibacter sp. TaxID=2024849 RepID=UPI003F8719EE
MKKYLLILVIYLSFINYANAIGKLGAFSCGDILEFKNIKDSQESVQDWVNGFLTAVQLGRKPFEEGKVPSNNSRYFWIIKFCEENPLSDIAEASSQLYLEIAK